MYSNAKLQEDVLKKIYIISVLIPLLFVLSFFSTSLAAEKSMPVCKSCHKSITPGKVVHPAVDMGCNSCHTQPHDKKAKIPKGLSAESPELCFQCHDKTKFTKKTVHPPVAGGMCNSCHNVHSTDNPKILLSPMPELCYGCHDKAKFENKSVHPPVAGGMCTGCHDPHSSEAGKLLLAKSPELCFKCHNKGMFTGKKFGHSPVSAGLCTSCHGPHATAAPKLLLSDPPGLCFNCHAKDKFTNTVTHPPVASGMCNGCHHMHQGDVDKLLLSEAPELCYLCHERKDKKRNVHPPILGGMCSACHDPHASKYDGLLDKPSNGVCVTCHANKKDGAHVIRGFDRRFHPVEGVRDISKPKESKKKLTCYSCHDPHQSDSGKLFKFDGSGMGLCLNCHKK